MLNITGDTHGALDIRKLNTSRFPEQRSMTKQDYVAIMGDFGMVWDNGKEDLYWRKWPRSYQNSVLVFGHIHNRATGDAFDYYLKLENMLNAGVDINHYCPVTFHQLVENNKYFRESNKQ